MDDSRAVPFVARMTGCVAARALLKARIYGAREAVAGLPSSCTAPAGATAPPPASAPWRSSGPAGDVVKEDSH